MICDADEIDAGRYLLRNEREGVCEGLVAAELLKQHENENVQADDGVIYDRRDRPVGIVVADREHIRLYAETVAIGPGPVTASSSASSFPFVVAERTFPFCDHDRRQAVADDVDHRAGHVHQLVDAEDENDALDRQVNDASVPSRITSDARGTPATPFDVSISVATITICCVHDSSTPAA